MEHLFCSIQMMTHRHLWDQVGPAFYDYIVVDEAHHGTATSYRPLFDHFDPRILLGLTATPGLMDDGNIPEPVTGECPDFLFSRKRLNVDLSRARSLDILIANPRLLEIACNTVEQMGLINTLCRGVLCRHI